MTRKKNRTGLSNTQNVRLGGLIAVIAVIDSREPYEPIMKDLETRGFALKEGNNVHITDKGRKETVRLATLAGLMSAVDRKG